MRQVIIKNDTRDFGCTGSLTVVAADSGEVICSITANGGTRQRDLDNSYDRHRAIKEGSLSTLEITGYDIVGDVQSTIDNIKRHLPECLHESRFARPYAFKSDDAWPVFDFFRTITEGGGFYGDTPKPLIKKIKAAWKKGIPLFVD